jgi:dienelactone hydrolase
MDTLSERWAKLAQDTLVIAPEDETPRPAVILFHGCGGVRAHLPRYAEAAKAAGWRAFIVDSYAMRGWGRLFSLSMVCTGAVLRGHERAGDVLAAIEGISARPDVDAGKIVVAGWSHGGWSIMELLAAPRTEPGELGLADAASASLAGVKGAWMAYPYVGPFAFARHKTWRHKPRTEVCLARTDHLTTVRNAEKVFGGHRSQGCEIDTWIAEGTHSFDEPASGPLMRHDAAVTEGAIARFQAFLKSF